MLLLLNSPVFMDCIHVCQETSALHQQLLKAVRSANCPCCHQQLASHTTSYFPEAATKNKLTGSKLTHKKSRSMSIPAPLPAARPQQATSAFKISQVPMATPWFPPAFQNWRTKHRHCLGSGWCQQEYGVLSKLQAWSWKPVHAASLLRACMSFTLCGIYLGWWNSSSKERFLLCYLQKAAEERRRRWLDKPPR